MNIDFIKEYWTGYYVNNEELWKLKNNSMLVKIQDLYWNLTVPFWHNDNKLFDLCPLDVINMTIPSSIHSKKIALCNTSYPLHCIIWSNNRLTIVDGMHRLSRLTINQSQYARIILVSENDLKKISFNRAW